MDDGWGWLRVTLGTIGVILLCLLAIVGIWVGYATVHRSQQRANANNKVKVTHILIRNAQQQAQVVHAQNAKVQALAEQRVIEAEGIRKSQDLIARTLTAQYLQHEAIQAMLHGAPGDRIYIPAGSQGIPLVANVNSAEEPVK